MYKGASAEIDVPYGECNISVWIINKSEEQILHNLITKSGEIVEINVEIGGIGIY